MSVFTGSREHFNSYFMFSRTDAPVLWCPTHFFFPLDFFCCLSCFAYFHLGADSKNTSNGLIDRCSELSSSDPTQQAVKMDKYMKVTFITLLSLKLISSSRVAGFSFSSPCDVRALVSISIQTPRWHFFECCEMKTMFEKLFMLFDMPYLNNEQIKASFIRTSQKRELTFWPSTSCLWL